MKTMIYIAIILLIIICICSMIEQYYGYDDQSWLELLRPEWFESPVVFPRDHVNFICSKNCKNYWTRVIDGYNMMANKKVVMAGLCINIEKKIPILNKKIEHIGKYFKDYKCVIFENDSKDNTRPLLKGLTVTNSNIKLVDCPDAPDCKYKAKSAIEHGPISEERMIKMSKYRNKLLDFIKSNYSDYDCVMFMDLDFKGPIDVNGIANSFGYYDIWDTISSFGLSSISPISGYPTYHDTLAYDDGIHSVYNSDTDALNIILKLNKKRIGDEPIKVLSGFGGLAIYKMEVFNKNNIDYTPDDGKYICEHIILHNNMIKNGYDKIYTNPNMVLLI
jgi:hypothetical protein